MSNPLHDVIHQRLGVEWGPAFVAGPRRVAMTYPSPYRAGMSSLGFQWIATRLVEAGMSVERCFLPDDPEAWRRARAIPVTYETRTPLSHFPLIAVSLAYEMELTGLFELLDGAGIPLLREDRGPTDPLVLLGGPITMANPLPVAPFVDAVLLGEAEHVVGSAAAALFDCGSREAWLDAVQALPGAWIPERHGTSLPRAAVAPDELLPARSRWITPDAELADMFLLEGERGCHRMCTFCVMRRTTGAGMRLVEPEAILSLVPERARRVGLVGAAISDHPRLVEVLETLVRSGRQVSVSSLRADRVKVRPRIAELLRASGARTFTVASDGASARLRKGIEKGTTEAHLLAAATQASRNGFEALKVYMMLGLPGETDEDVDELVAFTVELAAAARPAKVVLGVAPFVAKLHTPLEGAPWAGTATVDRRVKRLLRGLRGKAEVRPTSARWAWVEYELAQGGPETGLALMAGWRAGGRFADLRRALEAVDPSSRRPWDPSSPSLSPGTLPFDALVGADLRELTHHREPS